MALDSMRRAYASDEVREMVEMRLKAQHDEASRLYEARQEGLQEGESRALSSVARRMLEAGADWEAITRLTGLGPEDLQD